MKVTVAERTMLRAGPKAAPASRGGGTEHRRTLENVAGLARVLSHSFNNILTISRGNMALLREELPEGSPAMEMADDIDAALARANRLSSDLAALAQFRPYRARQVSLGSFLRRRSAAFSALAGAGHVLEIEVDSGLPLVAVDPGYLELAINALLMNASSATGGTGVLRVACARWNKGTRNPSRPGSGVLPVALGVEWQGERPTRHRREDAFRPGGGTEVAAARSIGMWLVREIALTAGGADWLGRRCRGWTFAGILLPAAG